MSNLLEFQHTLLTKGKAVYSIATSELNPSELETEINKPTVTSIPKEAYSVRNLREFIQVNSQTLTDNGDIIKGEVINENVVLTVLNKVE